MCGVVTLAHRAPLGGRGAGRTAAAGGAVVALPTPPAGSAATLAVSCLQLKLVSN